MIPNRVLSDQSPNDDLFFRHIRAPVCEECPNHDAHMPYWYHGIPNLLPMPSLASMTAIPAMSAYQIPDTTSDNAYDTMLPIYNPEMAYNSYETASLLPSNTVDAPAVSPVGASGVDLVDAPNRAPTSRRSRISRQSTISLRTSSCNKVTRKKRAPRAQRTETEDSVTIRRNMAARSRIGQACDRCKVYRSIIITKKGWYVLTFH